jgi:hypothetical protein
MSEYRYELLDLSTENGYTKKHNIHFPPYDPNKLTKINGL